ncbi:MAG: hypothetical protein NTNFB02_01010 [Nitrospira sp.]
MRTPLVAIAALTAVLALPVSGIAQETPANQKSPTEQLVDAFNAVFGAHPGLRGNHPKGVVLEGSFTPSTDVSLSRRAQTQ